MPLTELTLPPHIAFDQALLREAMFRKANLRDGEGAGFRIMHRSIDARPRVPVVNVHCLVSEGALDEPLLQYDRSKLPNVAAATKRVLIVGAGPAGLFAALRLIELGFKPIVVERGSDVRARRRDLADINKKHIVNPESNYCFGEGGAGTYSDGKLYTRSKKRGDIRRILEIMVAHGAVEEILYEAHPHIGTNKLPALVQAWRETILERGGEVLFNTRVDDLVLKRGQIIGVLTNHGESILADATILATGHSARDIFELLHRREVLIEAKPYAIGVRVEHQQKLIDQIQYRCQGARDPLMPAASYSLVTQVPVNGVEKGVFSFCMCPGGFIVPSATAPGELVVNGMSPSRRDSAYANSGIVVSVDHDDWKEYQDSGPLAGLRLQQAVEQAAWAAGGSSQTAPAQLLHDFTKGRTSSHLHPTSYQPGLKSVAFQDFLPPQIAQRLMGGFVAFGHKMKGYVSNDAQIIGVESRTSSPVRIPRDKVSLMHPELKGFFPCGEGAGYAGGIMSAAMDGERCAEAAVAFINGVPLG
jgi:uncharacterized FAD-dependent dehydrogenase